MRILFVPDGLWGELSGHRSAKYLIKAFNLINVSIAVYASKKDYTDLQHKEIRKNNCLYFPKSNYNYTQQFFRKNSYQEFEDIVKEYKPDLVFYLGTIKNKISIDYCIKHNIKYVYLPLTNEYYCIKHYSGFKNYPCYKCLHGSLTAPLLTKCMPKEYGLLKLIKDKCIEYMSRRRVLNADKVIGYGQNQINTLIDYGVKKSKTTILPVFFDPNSGDGIKARKGERFLITGQFLSDKGSFLVPHMIKNTKNVKYKAIIANDLSDNFVMSNQLETCIKDGTLEIIDFLKSHDLLLKEIAQSKGVLIPSFYPTTGEFTMIEALMFGKPVVAFNVGVHQDIFIDEENGMIAEAGNLNQYFKKIEQLNNDPELFDKVSKNAHKLFYEITSFRKFSKDIKNIIM